ncbi:hypothetical protein CRYUN_Cryun32bG0029300 [Craigia yunnanensis]
MMPSLAQVCIECNKPFMLETMEAKTFNQSLPCFILLLFSLLSNMAIADDDSAAMAMLAATIQPTPPNWSTSSSDCCQWQGVQCECNRVSEINLDSMPLTSVLFPLSLQTKLNANLDDNNFCTNTGNSCDPQVTTLLEIAAALRYPLKLSDSWSGNDACKNWSFVSCDSEKNINTIDPEMQHFGGRISPAFASFHALEYLYLKDNNLTGPIPDSLTRLPYLQVLDVSNNNLSGHTPPFGSSMILIVTGNPLLFTSTTGNKRVIKVIVIIAAILGAITGVIFVFLLGKSIAKHKAKRERSEVLNEEESFSKFSRHNVLRRNISIVRLQEIQLLNFQELATATNNFHPTNKLGQGGFGPVYRGKFPDGQEVAVKRLSIASEQRLEEFMNEVEVISKLQLRNLVKLIGCCTERQEKMLVYEYMPNKSLDAFLFDPQRQPVLDWRKRFNIIEGIGRGLQYLHWDSGLRIVHSYLKASNILLDEDLNPKISDFGMARIFGGNEDQANTKRIVGTYGYMSPEYAMEGQFSEKSDNFMGGKSNMSTVVSMLRGEVENLLTPKQIAFTDRKTTMDDSLLTEKQCSINYVSVTIVEGR